MDGLPFLLYTTSRRGGSKNAAKKKKPKADNWFETLSVAQLKDLCKAAKVRVSGTKPNLCQRLLSDNYIRSFGHCNQNQIKYELKEKMLVQSGNKYTQVLRLVQNEKGTGQAKRAATETIIDGKTGEEVQVLKKRKIIPKPETMYTRIEKKIKSVSQKKYQTNYGSKEHAPDVFDMLKKLLNEFCIENKIFETDPMLAFRVAKAGFSALYDNWQFMERPGYAGDYAPFTLRRLEIVLKAVRHVLSQEDIEEMVAVLENVNVCMGDYCVNMSYPIVMQGGGSWQYESFDHKAEKINIIHSAIRVIMPSYDEKKRDTNPKRKHLDCDMRGLAAMNGIPYP